jgi:hypothetical protein
MIRIAFASMLLVGISGCATEPMATNAATLIPSSRVLSPELTRSTPGMASLVLKRDIGLNNAACNFRLFIDGRAFADIGTGEKIQIHTLPGEHIIGAMSNGICFAGNAEAAITLAAGQTRIYRVSVGSGGELKLQPTAF